MIKDRLDLDAELTPGKVGQFDVLADGKLVFSKNTEGRFPEPDEVVDAIGD